MCFILAKIKDCTTTSNTVKSLTVLHAIRGVAQAWSQVSSVTSQKCFKKEGILNQSFQVLHREVHKSDPFVGFDDDENKLARNDEVENPFSTN